MYQALYRTYRPKTFSEVLGQEHIVRILKNQIKSDAGSHAYLFCGTRGTGKTTMARLLAEGINCSESPEGGKPCGHCENCRAIQEGSFIDVIEIDAASNNGVDDVRALKESVLYPPAVGKKKVYIIDEVHMLSNSAFNALLKTLEEPPEYVVFILCTTEPEKLLQTVLSRCLRLDFRRVPEAKILEGMKRICADLGIEAEEDALRIAAVKADGSVRDGLSILDQCLSGGDRKIGKNEVLEYLGTAGQEAFLELTEHILNRRLDAALLLIQELLNDGKDVRQLLNDFLEHYRGLLIVKFLEKPEDILGMSSENIKRLRRQSERMELSQINNGIVEISKTIADAKWSNSPRVLLELCIVKLVGFLGAVPVRALTEEKAQEAPAPEKEAYESPEAEPESSEKPKPVSSEMPEKSVQASLGFVPEDLEELWQELCDKGGFNALRDRISIHSLDEKRAVLKAQSKMAKANAENKLSEIGNIFSAILGCSIKAEVKLEEELAADGGAAERAHAEEVAAKASKVLGVEVSIEE